MRMNGRAVAIAAATLVAGVAYAGDVRKAPIHRDNDSEVALLTTIDVPGGLTAFDISFVDPLIDLYVLADRTNAAVDFFDPKQNKFLGRVTGFKGIVTHPDGTANNDLSGPDGVVIVGHKEVWAGDGDSTVKVIDIKSQKIVDTISTGGTARADEMTWDMRDHLLVAANNADEPPFITFISTDTHKVLGKIVFDGTHNTPDATNGIEQPQWSSRTGFVYLSVPQVGPNEANGGIAVIDPVKMEVVRTFPVANCSPAGLTIGPDTEALVGCGASANFGNAPPVTVIIDTVSGEVVRSFTQVVGSDEVWFNAGDGNYYLAARNNPASNGGPSLGVIDDEGENMFLQNVPTSASAHSVAADFVNNHVFVPIGAATTAQPNSICAPGCIAVYAHRGNAPQEATR